MRIFRHYHDLPSEARNAIVAIGNFDGIHRGHQAVIGEAVRRAKAAGAPSAVLSFEPHPRRYFRPTAPPFLLTRLRTKARVIAELGIDALFVLRFNAALAGRTAEAFIDEVLVEGLSVREAVVGYDFVFGKGRRGSPELLRDRLVAAGRTAMIMPAVTAFELDADAGPDAEPEGFVISSTAVRDSLMAGDPRAAARLLGRPFEIEGRVIAGDRRGRTLGYPTANLRLGDYLRPAFGVYAVRAAIERPGQAAEWHDGVANLGLRPMFETPEPLLEVHLFGFSGELYRLHLRVALVDYLRPEASFEGLDQLVAQMGRDAAAARAALARPAPARKAPPRL